MNIKETITQQFIELLKAGAPAVRKLWQTARDVGFPYNYQTKRPYRGWNVLALWAEAMDKGYTSPAWLTFKQARELGGCVRKGEHGTLGIYFEMRPAKDAEGNPKMSAEGKPAMVPFARAFYLFNVAQIDGLPADAYGTATATRPAFADIEAAEAIMARSGASIIYGGARAFYRPATDDVHMPERTDFVSPASFYAVAFHELTHWTGGATRLNRTKGKKFGDEAYAFEELVAEIGAAFVCAEVGILPETMPDHASYVASWIKVLQSDNGALLAAASEAGRAADFLIGKTPEATDAAAGAAA